VSSDLAFAPIEELSPLIARKQLSPVEVVTAVLERIERYNGKLHSYITVCHDAALRMAREAEQEIMRGHWRGPLHGIPVSHKDVSWTAGVRTTAHSRVLSGFVPREDATHVRRLRETGMILVGKTNTTELACGATELFGTPPTPWNMAHYAGSSSCGSGSAVAAGLAVAATGTDTGGSVRIPASFCGIVGLRPTFGRVSRYGVVPLSWSMDQVGPMTRSVHGCALMLQVMAGDDPRDRSTSAQPVHDYATNLNAGIRGMVLGIPERHFFENLDTHVDSAIQIALHQLERLGARLETISLTRAKHLNNVGDLVQMVEGFSQHAASLRKHASLYGERARRRIAAGAFYSAADYLQALQVRRLWCWELHQTMQRIDAIVTPTTPFTAITVDVQDAAPPSTGANTFPFSLSGHPAISVPCGFAPNNLPIGMQIVAGAFEESKLLQLAYAYEQAAEWSKRRPLMEASDEGQS
jgi:aspartyl-tRNA(Asn)/glutamyl-tRNA(Gln) amidotransferase subunit A